MKAVTTNYRLIFVQKTKAKAAPKAAKAAPKAAAKPKKATAPKAPAAKKLAQTTLKAKPKAAPKKRPKPDSEDEQDDSMAQGSLHDDSLLSATPPSAKKQKTTKKIVGQPLAERENDVPNFDGADDEKPQKGSTDKYQKVWRHNSFGLSVIC